MELNKTLLASRINVTRQTINNWEKSKPELIRLLTVGMRHDTLQEEILSLLLPENKQGETIESAMREEVLFGMLIGYAQDFPEGSRVDDILPFSEYSSFYLAKTDVNTLYHSLPKEVDQEIVARSIGAIQSQLYKHASEKALSVYLLTNLHNGFATLIEEIAKRNSPVLFNRAIDLGLRYFVGSNFPDMGRYEKNQEVLDKKRMIYELPNVTPYDAYIDMFRAYQEGKHYA